METFKRRVVRAVAVGLAPPTAAWIDITMQAGTIDECSPDA